jgi:four helix bundle protein
MFLKLDHQKLDGYISSRVFVPGCYKQTKALPVYEKFGRISHVRRDSLSVPLNMAEGASRKPGAERKKYYQVGTGSVMEIDAAMDIANYPGYIKTIDTTNPGQSMIASFKLFTGLIKSYGSN